MLETFLILFSVFDSIKSAEILLLHTNDLRGNLEGTYSNLHARKIGGYSRLSYIISKARNQPRSAVLYLDSGDVYSDPLWSDGLTRKILIELANHLNPDAASLGCHNYLNPEIMREFLGRIKFPVVVSNLKFRPNKEIKILPNLILNIGGIRLGLVGYVTPKMHVLSETGEADDGIQIEDEIIGVSREVQNLIASNVSLIIALGHSGHQTDRIIAEEIAGIDVILGGFSHGLYWNDRESPGDERIRGGYPIVVKNRRTHKDVLIFHTYGFAKYLGQIRLKFDEESKLISYDANPIFLGHDLPENPEMTHMIRIYKRAVKSVENDDEVLARSVVPLDTAQIRYQENSVANLVTDSFIYRAINIYQDSLDYSRGFYTDAAVSMINAGALRESFATTKTNPNITLGMVKELIPYRQHLVKLSLPGFVIVLCLEIGTASNGETNRGEFLQFSGLRMIYNHKSKAGYRVESVRIRCAECSQPTFGRLQQVDAYKVIITAFLANGGDGHSVIKSEGANLTVLPVFDVDVFAEYLRLVREIRPELNERIIDVGHSQNRWKLIPVLNGGSRFLGDVYHDLSVFISVLAALIK